jgi:hypothetical protein
MRVPLTGVTGQVEAVLSPQLRPLGTLAVAYAMRHRDLRVSDLPAQHGLAGQH